MSSSLISTPILCLPPWNSLLNLLCPLAMFFISYHISAVGSQIYSSNLMFFPEFQIQIFTCLQNVTLKLLKTSNSTYAHKTGHLMTSSRLAQLPISTLYQYSWLLPNSLMHPWPLFHSFSTKYLFLAYPMPGTMLGDGDVVMKKRHVGETNKNVGKIIITSWDKDHKGSKVTS